MKITRKIYIFLITLFVWLKGREQKKARPLYNIIGILFGIALFLVLYDDINWIKRYDIWEYRFYLVVLLYIFYHWRLGVFAFLLTVTSTYCHKNQMHFFGFNAFLSVSLGLLCVYIIAMKIWTDIEIRTILSKETFQKIRARYKGKWYKIFGYFALMLSMVYLYYNVYKPDLYIACDAAFSYRPSIARKHASCTSDDQCTTVHTGLGGCSCPLPVNKRYSGYYKHLERCNMKNDSNMVCSTLCGFPKIKCNWRGRCQ